MKLSDFFAQYPKVAIAFSGGVDSAYLLYAAISCGAQVKAYFVKSAFQPQFELNDALRLAKQLNADLEVIRADVLSCPAITANSADRCYHCKKLIFTLIAEKATQDGYDTLLDGTNFSDNALERPGMRALHELSVLSPLRECEITKDEIRSLSMKAGLFTWDKPAYSCLATRIQCGEEISACKLSATELSEDYLFSLGFTDFRVRLSGGSAKIQVPAAQLEKVIANAAAIVSELKKYYRAVTLDLEVRDEQ